MIHGSGVDIVQVARIKASVERFGPRFIERIFSPKEAEACMRRTPPYPCLAARFAAKEAVIKALSSSLFIKYPDIEILNDPSGKPYLNPLGTMAQALSGSGVKHIHISLSHERDYAVASAIAEL